MENASTIPKRSSKNLADYCAPGTKWTEQMVSVSDNVKLRVVEFHPQKSTTQPTVLFIAGWISLMRGWKIVLKEMTKDFNIIYVETREKISSKVIGKVEFSVEAIAQDIVTVVDIFKLEKDKYIIFGSSLGGTAILESYKELKTLPSCFTLLGPNAEYRTPLWGKIIIVLFWTRLYAILKPFIKWYLRNFRLDIETDHAQYEKYCNALDAADPKKLKPAALALSKYKVWDILKDIDLPVLIIGATKDLLHEPQNLIQMDKMLPNSKFLDMETNTLAHGAEMVIEIRKYIEHLK
ncbi:MAG: alpha/beta hydrolase [Candidatus Neomarinimicrobiota bacterium]